MLFFIDPVLLIKLGQDIFGKTGVIEIVASYKIEILYNRNNFAFSEEEISVNSINNLLFKKHTFFLFVKSGYFKAPVVV